MSTEIVCSTKILTHLQVCCPTFSLIHPHSKLHVCTCWNVKDSTNWVMTTCWYRSNGSTKDDGIFRLSQFQIYTRKHETRENSAVVIESLLILFKISDSQNRESFLVLSIFLLQFLVFTISV